MSTKTTSAKKTASPKTDSTPPTETASALVTVAAVKDLHEDGVNYAPGDSFQVSPDRAKALGPLVKVQ
ncbi:hypothetical protein AAFN60_02040 [Roseibacillus persicicus]|uniref:hypothetical protein n=1 Tax=Roseibacillus persicicus TaxID=454148 RepID=UPI00398B0DE7